MPGAKESRNNERENDAQCSAWQTDSNRASQDAVARAAAGGNSVHNAAIEPRWGDKRKQRLIRASGTGLEQSPVADHLNGSALTADTTQLRPQSWTKCRAERVN